MVLFESLRTDSNLHSITTMTVSLAVNTIYERHRLLDRHTDTAWLHRLRLYIASRGKK